MRILLLWWLVGCHTYSSVGPLVTDLRVTGQGIDVERCYLTHETDSYIYLLLVPPVFIGCALAPDLCDAVIGTRRTTRTTGCSTRHEQLGGNP